MNIEEQNCSNCHFVGQGDIKDDLSRERWCRRYPPTLLVMQTPQGPGFKGQFPPVNEQLVCGEWAPGADVVKQ